MLTRIVKLTIEPSKKKEFESHFYNNQYKISNFDGCKEVILLKENHNGNIYFTYSIWSNEEALELYRSSSLFNKIWKETKTYFCGRPEAWSLNKIAK